MSFIRYLKEKQIPTPHAFGFLALFIVAILLPLSIISAQTQQIEQQNAQTMANPAPRPTSAPTTSVSEVMIGDNSIESNSDSNKPGQAEAFSYLASSTGTVGNLSIFVDKNNTSSQVVVGVYNDINDKPGTLLKQTTIVSPGAGKWDTMAVPPIGIIAGKKYWIAVLGSAGKGVAQFRDRSSGGISIMSAQINLTAFPQVWSSGQTWSSYSMSAYATQ